MYRQNQYRSGRSSVDTSSNTGTLQWSYNFNPAPGPNALSYGPVVGIKSATQGGIYVGDVLGNLYSLTSTGTIAWQISLPGGTQVLPNAVGFDGTVYAVRPYENLYADSPSGTLKWAFSVPGGLSPYTNLAISGNTIYAGNTCGVLYALNTDESVKWTFGTFQDCRRVFSTISPAIASDGTIYSGVFYGDFSGVLYALKSDGTLLWSSSAYAGTPAIDPNSGIIYVTSLDGLYLYALNSGGMLRWQVYSPLLFSLPAIAGDGTIYVGTQAELWAINPNGTIKWQVSLDNPSGANTPPTIGGDGTIYIGHNSLFAFNPDGALKWSTQLCGGQGFAALDEPVIAIDGTIYMIADQAGPCPLEAFH
jgi:outer membrane protein assembly factor BamB